MRTRDWENGVCGHGFRGNLWLKAGRGGGGAGGGGGGGWGGGGGGSGGGGGWWAESVARGRFSVKRGAVE